MKATNINIRYVIYQGKIVDLVQPKYLTLIFIKGCQHSIFQWYNISQKCCFITNKPTSIKLIHLFFKGWIYRKNMAMLIFNIWVIYHRNISIFSSMHSTSSLPHVTHILAPLLSTPSYRVSHQHDLLTKPHIQIEK